jgi:hypothetical protein
MEGGGHAPDGSGSRSLGAGDDGRQDTASESTASSRKDPGEEGGAVVGW